MKYKKARARKEGVGNSQKLSMWLVNGPNVMLH